MRAVGAILLCMLGMSANPVSVLRQVAARPVESGTPGFPPAAETGPRFAPSGSAQKPARSTRATAGLQCIQNALGGTKELAAVSALRFIGNTRPKATTRPRPYATRIDIGMAFPERFKIQTVQTDAPPGLQSLTGTLGFNGGVLLANPRVPGPAVPKVMPRARQEFVRQMLMRLPRELPGVRLSQRVARDSGRERLAIDAFSPGLVATLLADVRTCMPAALQYTTRSMAEGSDTYRVDLSEYRRFGGIRFPTLMKKVKNGLAWEDEYVLKIEVNAPFDDQYFRQ